MAGAHYNEGRMRARRCAVQALYQWQLGGATPEAIIKEFLGERDVKEVDVEYFTELTRGAIRQFEALQEALLPALDRPWDRLGPVERSVLLVGAWELAHSPHIPWRIVVNESIELSKMFGSNEAHRFINGVLDRTARKLRQVEISGEQRAPS